MFNKIKADNTNPWHYYESNHTKITITLVFCDVDYLLWIKKTTFFNLFFIFNFIKISPPTAEAAHVA